MRYTDDDGDQAYDAWKDDKLTDAADAEMVRERERNMNELTTIKERAADYIENEVNWGTMYDRDNRDEYLKLCLAQFALNERDKAARQSFRTVQGILSRSGVTI